MIDLNLDVAIFGFLSVFDMDDAEYFGYDDELFALDFKKKEDAVYAIKKWLKSSIDEQQHRIPNSYFYKKEGLRYLITKDRLPYCRNAMPGWEDCSMEEFEVIAKNFLLWLWETLYEEPFLPADLSQYRVRTDKAFVDNPNNPELWGEPKYQE